MTASPALVAYLRRTSLTGLVVAVIAAAVCAWAYLSVPERFYASYLTAFVYWLGLSLGSLYIAMIHGLTGGAWGRVIRRILEAGYETLVLMALLFVPIGLNVTAIYEWTDPEVVQQHETLLRKAAYLNVAGYQTRAVVYFAIWIVAVLLLNWFSPRNEVGFNTRRLRRLQLVSGLSMVAYGFSLTLAMVDWVMSLEPEWYSTMYGLIHIGGQAVSGLALALVVMALLREKFLPWSESVTPDRCNELGNLLLAALMFWAYCSFFQYLVIWSGNLPDDNVWYVRRSHGGWQYFALVLMLFHFAVPFFLLLMRPLKREPASLARIAGLLLVMRYVDIYWMVKPAFQGSSNATFSASLHWLDLVAWAAIGGAWIALFAWRLSMRLSVPVLAPELMEVVHEPAR